MECICERFNVTADFTLVDHVTVVRIDVLDRILNGDYVLSNILGQVLIELGEAGGINQLIKENAGVRAGAYVYNGILTNEMIGNKLGMSSQDINLLLAAF